MSFVYCVLWEYTRLIFIFPTVLRLFKYFFRIQVFTIDFFTQNIEFIITEMYIDTTIVIHRNTILSEIGGKKKYEFKN